MDHSQKRGQNQTFNRSSNNGFNSDSSDLNFIYQTHRMRCEIITQMKNFKKQYVSYIDQKSADFKSFFQNFYEFYFNSIKEEKNRVEREESIL